MTPYPFVEDCPVCSLVINTDGMIVSSNVHFANMLHRDVDKLINTSLSKYIFQKDQNIFLKLRQNLLFKTSFPPFDLRFIKTDKKILLVRLFVHPLENAENEEIRYWLIVENRSVINQFKVYLNSWLTLESIVANLLATPQEEQALSQHEKIMVSLNILGLGLMVQRAYWLIVNPVEGSIIEAIEWCQKDIASRWQPLAPHASKKWAWHFATWQKKETVNIQYLDQLPLEALEEIKLLKTKGCKSFLQAVIHGTAHSDILCVIGMDSVSHQYIWKKNHSHMLHLVGSLLVNRMYRATNSLPVINQSRSPQIHLSTDPSLPDSHPQNSQNESDTDFLPPDDEIFKKTIRILHDEATPPPFWEFKRGIHSVLLKKQKILQKKPDQATITCPACGLTKEIPFSVFKNRAYQIKVKCPCQTEFQIQTELRTQLRKVIWLAGTYAPDITSEDWHPIQIKNLTRNGVGIKLLAPHHLQKGARFKIRFALDDLKSPKITKNVIARFVKKDYIGCQFLKSTQHDQLISRYF